jgi:hypothetical protein
MTNPKGKAGREDSVPSHLFNATSNRGAGSVGF